MQDAMLQYIRVALSAQASQGRGRRKRNGAKIISGFCGAEAASIRANPAARTTTSTSIPAAPIRRIGGDCSKSSDART